VKIKVKNVKFDGISAKVILAILNGKKIYQKNSDRDLYMICRDVLFLRVFYS
jgi:hypothetical protein